MLSYEKQKYLILRWQSTFLAEFTRSKYNRFFSEQTMLSKHEIFKNDISEDYLSNKERYEQGIKRSVIAFGLIRKMQQEGKSSMDDYRYSFQRVFERFFGFIILFHNVYNLFEHTPCVAPHTHTDTYLRVGIEIAV